MAAATPPSSSSSTAPLVRRCGRGRGLDRRQAVSGGRRQRRSRPPPLEQPLQTGLRRDELLGRRSRRARATRRERSPGSRGTPRAAAARSPRSARRPRAAHAGCCTSAALSTSGCSVSTAIVMPSDPADADDGDRQAREPRVARGHPRGDEREERRRRGSAGPADRPLPSRPRRSPRRQQAGDRLRASLGAVSPLSGTALTGPRAPAYSRRARVARRRSGRRAGRTARAAATAAALPGAGHPGRVRAARRERPAPSSGRGSALIAHHTTAQR